MKTLEDTLVAELQSPTQDQSARYAFYLLRNGKRIATRWYSDSSRAYFNPPHADGLYSAIGFVEDTNSGRRVGFRSNKIQIGQKTAGGGMHLPAPIDLACAEALVDTIDTANIQRLDVHIGRFTHSLLSSPKREGSLFVMLRGAEAERSGIVLPRFSRFSWRSHFPGTVVCIADGSLRMSDSLRLAWYFGSREQDATDNVCDIIRSLCRAYNIPTERVVAYGSSGGGYAALQVAARLGDGATAVAINAQVNILDYPIRASVDEFLATCVGAQDDNAASQQFGRRLSAIDAWMEPQSRNSRCLLVQNRIDRAHYTRHFKRFARTFGIPENGTSANGRMASIVYEHPSGHAAEPREIVPQILEQIKALQAAA